MYVSYTPNDNHSFSFSYGKRLNRPYYGRLNPFRWIISPYSYSEGNPYLQPSITHNLELEYSYKEYAISTLYFSKESGIIEELKEIDAKTNIARGIPRNFINKNSIGFFQKLIFKPFKFWNIIAVGEVFYDETKSDSPISLKSLNGWNSVFTWTNDFTLNPAKTLMLSASYRYFPKGVDNLDYNTSSHKLDMSFKALLLKKKLVVNLYLNDILKTNRITYTSFSNGIQTDYSHYYDDRFFRLSLSYTFGKSFQRTEHRSKNEEEISRTN